MVAVAVVCPIGSFVTAWMTAVCPLMIQGEVPLTFDRIMFWVTLRPGLIGLRMVVQISLEMTSAACKSGIWMNLTRFWKPGRSWKGFAAASQVDMDFILGIEAFNLDKILEMDDAFLEVRGKEYVDSTRPEGINSEWTRSSNPNRERSRDCWKTRFEFSTFQAKSIQINPNHVSKGPPWATL